MTVPPPGSRKSRASARVDDVRGLVRLAVDGVVGVTRIAQGLHGSILRVAPPLGRGPERPAGGIAGFVYGSVRSGSQLVGRALDGGLAGVQALLDDGHGDDGAGTGTQRRALVSALNGVLGDHLHRSGNPLAIAMRLSVPAVQGPNLLLLVHGLCMSDVQWLREGHDHGRALQEALGYSPVYAHYNSGRHVHENGAELAVQLETLIAQWPVRVERIAILGHSMGGLVARSALQRAQQAGMDWPGRLRAMVFLGTPHHGAALERGGNWLQAVFGVSPYLAPFGRLGRVRSDGITDLRHGTLLQRDLDGGNYQHRDTRTVVPLPRGVQCYAIAGSLGEDALRQVLGDGLVTVDSALGRHVRATHDLRFPPSRTWVAPGVHHLELLSDPGVYRKLRKWLALPAKPAAGQPPVG